MFQPRLFFWFCGIIRLVDGGAIALEADHGKEAMWWTALAIGKMGRGIDIHRPTQARFAVHGSPWLTSCRVRREVSDVLSLHELTPSGVYLPKNRISIKFYSVTTRKYLANFRSDRST
ncbi:hypothetical protein [Puniceibacterium sp. IMCC21224]|uniref:hypothetical protein n=1 Tax=Puniceibacterium sp. IMCC21224 TaxID=1618204 RepID=UPI00064DACC2|nr:hypothetical protein [Puniceibacterium sp. IMCC21224]KMK68893.1 hypothetical protein IMCC21224_113779 [Puniceibacterium sp. IMCC21224]